MQLFLRRGLLLIAVTNQSIALSFINSHPHHCTFYQSSPIGPPTLKPTPGPTNVPTLEPTFYPTWSPTITGEYFLHQWCVLFVLLLIDLQLTCVHVLISLQPDQPTSRLLILTIHPSHFIVASHGLKLMRNVQSDVPPVAQKNVQRE